MSIRKLHLVRPIFAIFLFSVLSACTIIHKPPKELVSGYEQTNTIPLKVGLVLNDELHDAKWENNNMGEVVRIPLGDSLTKNSLKLINKLFANVVVGTSTTEINSEDVDVIVTPTMISVEQTSYTWSWSPVTLTVFLEWRFQDKEGQLVWVDTIKGEGVAKHTSPTTRIKKTLDDLFKKSHEAISSSVEIKDLVNKRRD